MKTAANTSHQKTRTGRPSKYKPEYAAQAEAYCLMGANDERLAALFGVAESTINRWKREFSEFSESLTRGKDVADAQVAAALFKSATGGHVITEDRVVGDAVVTLTKKVPPDVTAQIFWLKNRQPTLWRDKVEVKEEINHNVFPPKEVLDAIYEKAHAEAEKRDAFLKGRFERLIGSGTKSHPEED